LTHSEVAHEGGPGGRALHLHQVMDEHGKKRRKLVLGGAAAIDESTCATRRGEERSSKWQAKQFHNSDREKKT